MVLPSKFLSCAFRIIFLFYFLGCTEIESMPDRSSLIDFYGEPIRSLITLRTHYIWITSTSAKWTRSVLPSKFLCVFKIRFSFFTLFLFYFLGCVKIESMPDPSSLIDLFRWRTHTLNRKNIHRLFQFCGPGCGRIGIKGL